MVISGIERNSHMGDVVIGKMSTCRLKSEIKTYAVKVFSCA